MKTALLLSVCLAAAAALAGPEDAYDRTTDGKKIAWMDRGKTAIQAKLKDPSSAQFKNVYFHRGADGIPVTCGEVNSKNSFGGYVGFQHFISGGTPELTFLQQEIEDFGKAWSKLCR